MQLSLHSTLSLVGIMDKVMDVQSIVLDEVVSTRLHCQQRWQRRQTSGGGHQTAAGVEQALGSWQPRAAESAITAKISIECVLSIIIIIYLSIIKYTKTTPSIPITYQTRKTENCKEPGITLPSRAACIHVWRSIWGMSGAVACTSSCSR